MVGIILNGPYCEPLTSDPEDIEATKRTWDFKFGWFANPIFRGDYPHRMKQRILDISKKEGRLRSRLPELTPEQTELVKGII